MVMHTVCTSLPRTLRLYGESSTTACFILDFTGGRSMELIAAR